MQPNTCLFCPGYEMSMILVRTSRLAHFTNSHKMAGKKCWKAEIEKHRLRMTNEWQDVFFLPQLLLHLQSIDKKVVTGVPHVRILRTRSKHSSKKDQDVVALQRVELINGKVQDPMAVSTSQLEVVSKLFYFVDLKGS